MKIRLHGPEDPIGSGSFQRSKKIQQPMFYWNLVIIDERDHVTIGVLQSLVAHKRNVLLRLHAVLDSQTRCLRNLSDNLIGRMRGVVVRNYHRKGELSFRDLAHQLIQEARQKLSPLERADTNGNMILNFGHAVWRTSILRVRAHRKGITGSDESGCHSPCLLCRSQSWS